METVNQTPFGYVFGLMRRRRKQAATEVAGLLTSMGYMLRERPVFARTIRSIERGTSTPTSDFIPALAKIWSLTEGEQELLTHLLGRQYVWSRRPDRIARAIISIPNWRTLPHGKMNDYLCDVYNQLSVEPSVETLRCLLADYLRWNNLIPAVS